MPTCEKREVQLEQRAHGALDPSEVIELEAHLVSCASCQAFATLIRRVENQLAERAAEAEKNVAWIECERRVHREARGMKALPWTLAALCLGVPAMFLAVFFTQLMRGRPSEVSGVMAAFTIVFFSWVFATGWTIRRRWLSRYTEAQASREELFSMFREQLAEDRRGSRQTAVTLLVAAAGCIGVSAFVRSSSEISVVLSMTLAAVFLAGGFYLLLGRVPQLDRQLRELG